MSRCHHNSLFVHCVPDAWSRVIRPGKVSKDNLDPLYLHINEPHLHSNTGHDRFGKNVKSYNRVTELKCSEALH